MAADGGTANPGTRQWPAAGPTRVPNWVYTDPEIFAREQERIFAGPNWLYVCLEAELPNPGDFVRSRLGTRETVAVRG
ncbi:MAG: 3-phenylpropionate dioxygenase, partial [Alphaproteobacteria bacterium]|nr:3-phenylpropionate dioxygenase [Alphaproteobacteria bacterium]